MKIKKKKKKVRVYNCFINEKPKTRNESNDSNLDYV